MDVIETTVLEELVDGMGEPRAHAEQRAVFIGARPQVGDGAQELVGMPLLLQRVILGTGPDDRDAIGLDFPTLPAPGRGDEPAFYGNRRAGAEVFDLGIIAEPGLRDDLDASQARPVVKLKKRESLRVPAGPDPALDEHPLARGVGAKERYHFVAFLHSSLFHRSLVVP